MCDTVHCRHRKETSLLSPGRHPRLGSSFFPTYIFPHAVVARVRYRAGSNRSTLRQSSPITLQIRALENPPFLCKFEARLVSCRSYGFTTGCYRARTFTSLCDQRPGSLSALQQQTTHQERYTQEKA
jgi:hypothetical protein